MNSNRLYRRIDLDTGLEEHLGVMEHQNQTYTIRVSETEEGAEIGYAETNDNIHSPSTETEKDLNTGFEGESYNLKDFNGFEDGVEALVDELEQQRTSDAEEALAY